MYEPLDQEKLRKPRGWSVECRVYAEDPTKFLPSIGTLSKYREPSPTLERCTPIGNEMVANVRCDSGVREGSEISMYYDPLICKLITYAPKRNDALKEMTNALDRYVIKGVTHNIPLLREVINHPRFIDAHTISTKFLQEEYPTGFRGHALTTDEELNLVAMSACLYCQRDLRDWSYNETERPMSKYPTRWELVVGVDGNAIGKGNVQ